MNWIFLSILANVAATFCLKLSSATAFSASSWHTKTTSLAAALCAYFVAFISYRQSLLSLQVGTAYALITSCTAILVGLMGVMIFGDSIDAIKVIGFILICIGIICISMTTDPINT